MATCDITDVHNPLPSNKQKEIYHKCWYGTISPNVPFREGGNWTPEELDSFVEAYQESVLAVLNNPHTFQDTLVINKRVDRDEKTGLVPGIDSSLSHFAVERGPDRGIVHAHGIIKIRTPVKNLMLGYKRFPEALLKELKTRCAERGLRVPTNIYADFDPLDALAKSLDSQERIMAYINKNKKEPSLDHASFVGEKKQRGRKKQSLQEELFKKPEPVMQSASAPQTSQERIEQIRQMQRKLQERRLEHKNGLEYPYQYYNDQTEPESEEEKEDEGPIELDEFEHYYDRVEHPIMRSKPIDIPAPPAKKSKVEFVQLQVPKKQ